MQGNWNEGEYVVDSADYPLSNTGWTIHIDAKYGKINGYFSNEFLKKDGILFYAKRCVFSRTKFRGRRFSIVQGHKFLYEPFSLYIDDIGLMHIIWEEKPMVGMENLCLIKISSLKN